jgi:hypothetical protein
MFLERNVDFHQPMCVGYKYAKSHFMLRMLHPSSALSCERLEILHPSAVAIFRMVF